jgi:hypothetical protein
MLVVPLSSTVGVKALTRAGAVRLVDSNGLILVKNDLLNLNGDATSLHSPHLRKMQQTQLINRHVQVPISSTINGHACSGINSMLHLILSIIATVTSFEGKPTTGNIGTIYFRPIGIAG